MSSLPARLPLAANGRRLRILVMVGNSAAPVSAANVYAERLAAHDVRFIEERVLSLRRIAAFSLRRLKKKGPRSLLGSYLFYLRSFAHPVQTPVRQYAPLFVTTDLGRDPAVIACIDAFAPDCILIGFCGLLPSAFLVKVNVPILNIHPGINPRYRGFGNIWAFYENNPDLTGYTIHEVDAGIDTGKRLAAAKVDFTGIPFDAVDVHAAVLAARHLSGLLLGQEEAHIPDAYRELPSACYGVPGLAVFLKARKNYSQIASGGQRG